MRVSQGLTAHRGYVIAGLGIGQILSWGSTFYLLTVLASPITADTGWPSGIVVAGISIGLVVAGLGSPRFGALVAKNHGRSVLIFCALALAVGLAVLGLAQNQWWYLGAWAILGLGMSGGLYSGAFAVLGHTYGASARTAITLLTLFGGFASTICWPLSTFLVGEVGWRWTALAYAAAHLLITAPLYALTVPRRPVVTAPESAVNPTSREARVAAAPRWPLILAVASVSTLMTSLSAMMAIHMFSLLAGIGILGAFAVALAATIGPSQVGARLIELLVGRSHHPLWTLAAATLAITVALTALRMGSFGAGAVAPILLIIVYGMGIGLNSIATGTVPLALFGQAHYARIMGRIALPALLAQAAAPLIGSVLIQQFGQRVTLEVLGSMAATAFLMTIGLLIFHYRRRPPALQAPTLAT